MIYCNTVTFKKVTDFCLLEGLSYKLKPVGKKIYLSKIANHEKK